MEAELIYKVVNKLVGPIRPVGDFSKDEQRLENLKTMCSLVIDLIQTIDSVAFDFRNHQEASIKRASDFAKKFIEDIETPEI